MYPFSGFSLFSSDKINRSTMANKTRTNDLNKKNWQIIEDSGASPIRTFTENRYNETRRNKTIQYNAMQSIIEQRSQNL